MDESITGIHATCPYCGRIDFNSFELSDADKSECGVCGGEYVVVRNVITTYTTSKIKAPAPKDEESEDRDDAWHTGWEAAEFGARS